MNVRKVSLFVVCLFAIATALGFVLLGLMIWVMETPQHNNEEHPPRGYPK